jgi:hypothetical protein
MADYARLSSESIYGWFWHAKTRHDFEDDDEDDYEKAGENDYEN